MSSATTPRSDETPTTPRLWRDRTFRAIWAGQTASLFGDQVTGLALPWLILAETHSPALAGAVLAARYVPLVLLGLVAGLVVDRVERRRLMLACDIGRALALGVVALVAALGHSPSLWLLTLVVLALGTGQLFFQAAYRAWLPDITGDAQLSRATAALEASDAASVLAGYPLAGSLIAAIGPALALGADGLSFVASAATLMAARQSTRTSPCGTAAASGASRALVGEALAGVRLIFAVPTQRLLKIVATALYLDAGAVSLLLATLTQIELRLSAWQAGLVVGAMGAGGLLSSTFAARIYAWDWRRGLALATGVAAIGSFALAWAGSLDAHAGVVVALIGDLVLDGAVALGFVLVSTASTLTTPPDLRGRVNAAGAIYSSAVRAIAVLGLGALAAHAGTFPAFLLLGICFVAAALIALRARTP